MDSDDLANQSVVKHSIVWAVSWPTVFPIMGLNGSTRFHTLDFLEASRG